MESPTALSYNVSGELPLQLLEKLDQLTSIYIVNTGPDGDYPALYIPSMCPSFPIFGRQTAMLPAAELRVTHSATFSLLHLL